MSDEFVVNTVCAHNCGGRSPLACTVRDGRLVRIAPADHPDVRYQGLCVRCLTLPQWVYAEERIATPLRRTGERGSGEFEPVSWDDALDEIAERCTALIDAHGARSIAFSRTSGSSQLANYSRLAALIGGGGSANFFGGVDMAVHMGLNNVLGFRGMFGQAANEWTDRPNTRNYLVWGNNPAETSMTSMRFLLDAREAGAEIVVIDPRYSATALHATWWVAPHPGTDLALALGMLHVLLDEGLVDEAFAKKHTVGPLLVRTDTGTFLRESDVSATGSGTEYLVVDSTGASGRCSAVANPRLRGHFQVGGHPAATAFSLLAELVADYPPERVTGITGVPGPDVRELARMFANGPSTIGFGYGVDRYLHGELLTRAGATMAVLTGNIGKPGTGVGVQSHGIGSRTARLGPVPPLPAWAKTESIPNIEVTSRDLPVRALFCQGDWLNQRMAHMARARDYLAGLDFVVTVDHFWQTTADWSDIVLPASTFLEGHDRVRDVAIAGNSVMLRRPVIPPVGDSRPDSEIEQALAERLGLGDYFKASPEDMVRAQIDGSTDPAMQGITFDGLLARGGAAALNVPSAPNVQYADLTFPTPTGRAEFYVEALAPLGEALPVYREDHEALPGHPSADNYPLVLVQAHARQRAHSTFFNTRWTLEIWPEPALELNPADAETRGLTDGDLAQAFNARGQVVARVAVSADYPPGMVNLSEGWKQHQYMAGNVQALTNGSINQAQRHMWGHANIPFYDTRVEVRLWQPEPPT